jgi:competence protein ComEC
MVVSGTQVSLIAAFVLLLVRRSPLPIWAGSLLVLAFLSLYVLTVGGTPSVLRAGVMSLAAVTAMVFSRQLNLYNSLAFALLVLLLLNPASLFDVSLQLSFLATFGIVVLVPLIIRATPSIPKIVSGTIAVTVGSQVMVAPALTYYFHRLPLVGFFANLVVVPCVAPLMALGIAMLAFSFFWPFAAALLGQVAAPLTEWMVWFVSAFSHWPGTGSGQAMLSLPGVWAFYVCLLALLSLLLPPVRKAITSQRAILAAAALAVIGGVWLVAKSTPQTLSITALDVDRGFCSVVQTPDGTSLIIDGGGPASERWNAGDTIILPFLLQQRIRKVDAVVVTDLDHDHTAGLPPVLAQMPVQSLVLVGRGDASSSSDRMLHEAQQRGVEVFYSGANQRLKLGEDVHVTPGANPSLGTEGAYFLVLSYGNVDFIWATRADRLPLMNLVERRGRQVVLFLPVGTRLTPELERMLSTGSFPGVVLLPRTRFDTLDSQFRNLVYSRGVKVFRTDLDGAVRVTTDGQSVKFRTFEGGR